MNIRYPIYEGVYRILTFKRGSRTRNILFGTGTVAHVGNDMYPLFGEQELCPAKVLATEITVGNG